jgi:hypothetical protein
MIRVGIPMSASEESFAKLIENFRQAKSAVREQAADWLGVIDLLKKLQTMQPNDAYLIQQLALATYKSELPDKLTALRNAKEILTQLAPATSSDAETVGIWGALHKSMWEQGKKKADLDQAIRAYERAYLLKTKYHNGAILAFLLSVRASLIVGDEAVADRVRARSIWGEVVDLCNDYLKSEALQEDEVFWVLASKAEALAYLRDPEAESALSDAITKAPETWMGQTLVSQITRSKQLVP